jgi:hypothetical protein
MRLKPFFVASFIALVMLCFSVRGANADPVVLTNGFASTESGQGQVNLQGSNFSLIYLGEIPFAASRNISMNSVTQGFGTVSFNGITTNLFRGSLSFNDTLLTGQVSGYATLNDLLSGINPLFTTDFVGTGAVTITGPRTQFDVSSVPEPGTMLMLVTGVGAFAAFRRKRSVRD